MANDETLLGQSGPLLRQSTGPRVFQFSLLGLFLLVTVTALILAIFFGVGRLVGMSTMEILTRGLGRFLYALPVMLVWIIGVIMAIRRLKRHRMPSTLTIIALTGLGITMVVLHVGQMVLIQLMEAGRISGTTMSWSLTATSIAYAIFHAAWWILVIAAIFVGRPADDQNAEAIVDVGSPLKANS